MSDTPETDDQPIIYAMNDNGYQVPCVDLEFARKLERERDEARQQLRIAVGLLSTQPQFADKHPEDVLAFVKEGGRCPVCTPEQKCWECADDVSQEGVE